MACGAELDELIGVGAVDPDGDRPRFSLHDVVRAVATSLQVEVAVRLQVAPNRVVGFGQELPVGSDDALGIGRQSIARRGEPRLEPSLIRRTQVILLNHLIEPPEPAGP